MGQMKWTQVVNGRLHFIWCHSVCQTSLILVLITRLANVVGWPWYAPSACPVSCLLPYLSQWDREKMWKSKSEKILGPHWRQFNRWSKAACASKATWVHLLLPIGRQRFSCLPESKASVHIASIWEEKCCNPMGIFHYFSFPWVFTAEHNIAWHGICLLSAEFISLSCVLTHFLVQLQPNPFRQELGAVEKTIQLHLKHWYVISPSWEEMLKL